MSSFQDYPTLTPSSDSNAGIGADQFVFSNSLDSSPIVQNDAKLLKENIPTDVYGAMMIIKTLMTRQAISPTKCDQF